MSTHTDEQEAVKKAESPKTEGAAAQEGAPAAPPKKKKIIAVYNTHNSKTGIKDPRTEKKRSAPSRPAGTTAARPAAKSAAAPAKPAAPAPKPAEAPAAKPATENTAARPAAAPQTRPASTESGRGGQGRPAQNRDGQRGGYQNRDGQRRDGQGGGYQNRDGQRSGYQNRDGQRRDGQGGGYQNRDGQRGGYQNRDGQRRDGQGGGYQNRDGQRGGYQNRDGQRRDGQGGGYQNRDGQNRGGQGRDNRRSSMDIPAAPVELRKTENRRAENKNRNDDTKKDKNTKFNDNWNGKPSQGGRRPNQGGNRPNQKGGKGVKGAVQTRQPAPAPKKEDNTPKVIEIPEMISIHDLAEKMKIQPSVIIKKLFLAGKMVTVNSELDFEAAGELAMEMNFDPVPEEKEDVIAKMLEDSEDGAETLVPRPPVVCVMGHVDHGKTSLLDAIRDTHVIDREAGGITQHIGAYVVTINGQKITFLDTPGHEAFTAMRMRGANSTDIAILVVAADDGVMPQTVEAINHAKAAGIEIIVAINKIDKPSANIERVKQELTEYELIPEDWGGSTIFCPVSAHTHEGIDNLLEMILLTSEVLELKANPNRRARGLVIEAELDKGKGPVATVLVQKGTLHVGDPIAVGSCHGKVRAMMDDNGRRVKEAGPSKPVEILGLNDVPNAGEIFVSPETDKEARAFAETYVKESREKLIEDTKLKMSLDDLYSQIQSGNLKELNIIVKADVQGSVEAVKQSLLKLSNEEVVVKIIHGGVGAINESDVSLAAASNAIIIGFNVRPDATAKETAEREKVDLRLYRVIYDAINDVEAAMKGMLDPIFEEKVLGHAEVRQIFKASGVGNIAGSYVLDGVFQRGCKCRITREGEQIFDGPLASLKRFKDDVKEVKAGYECGLVFEKFNDIKELDIVEAYTMVEVPR
ncbi:translation initiation factor IF-2 [Anaerosacchariphilus sp. NSJ-68]|uniref:Translation initiation factor IF-2 n=2 Tax=Lachnospiraceae TaxID=186803 RepID=A0A923RM04_9FIRM|nr:MULTISPECIES: translation initiation factor IF-2 [Lachnospiraceae]MBC5659769.1 translation initiation factor IF-2 [Anaerosacchariphilus hominis]MBC5697435.1 translation initiation factor IF-2 [Roseburia difficilis]